MLSSGSCCAKLPERGHVLARPRWLRARLWEVKTHRTGPPSFPVPRSWACQRLHCQQPVTSQFKPQNYLNKLTFWLSVSYDQAVHFIWGRASEGKLTVISKSQPWY